MRILLLLVLILTSAANAQQHVMSEQLGDTDIRIEFHQRIDAGKRASLSAWVRDSAATVNAVYGRFPTPKLRVVLRPTFSWRRSSAVSFGRTTRSGGGTVELFINPERPIEDFYADWTATHEFSHLMLPLLERQHRWLSEGFATYYQNVLMARAGRYTPEHAWQRLADGFERGRKSRPDLSPNESRNASNARMKYYWSGAALAFLADIELRKQSGGRQSLDSVLGELESCCLPARYRWSGPALMRRLDEFLERPLFVPLWRQYADRSGFPDIESLLTDPDYRQIRAGIMRPKT